jgi:tRNA (mo5U34)-methyltransferase
MDLKAEQAEIDRHHWYHEFDFGNGLRATSHTEDVRPHRRVWRFIERHLDAVDFRGQTVLDIGAWDGYWSFYAERRGAKSVLATDDLSQNWSDGQGIHIARRLLRSDIEINQHLSVYELSSLGRTFDIVLCLGVYYHLQDPLLAFAQIRHCCHPGSLVLLEGDAAVGLNACEARFNFADGTQPAYLPSPSALNLFLQAAYLRVRSQHRMGYAFGLRALLARLRHRRRASCRLFTVCEPFVGANPVHPYRAPFGLDRYAQDRRAAAA